MISREGTRGSRAIRIERDVVLPQNWEKLLLSRPDDRIVLSFVNTRDHEPFLLAHGHDPLHLIGRVVRQPEPPELALPPSLVHGLARLLEGRVPIRMVQVHHVHLRALGKPQVLQRPPDAAADLGRRVDLVAGAPVRDDVRRRVFPCGGVLADGGPGYAAELGPSDLGVDREAGAGVDGAETHLGRAGGVGRVATGGVEVADAALVGEVKEGAYLLGGVIFGDFVYG